MVLIEGDNVLATLTPSSLYLLCMASGGHLSVIRIETEKDTYSQRDVSNRFRMEGHGHEVQQGCRSTDLDRS